MIQLILVNLGEVLCVLFIVIAILCLGQHSDVYEAEQREIDQ